MSQPNKADFGLEYGLGVKFSFFQIVQVKLISLLIFKFLFYCFSLGGGQLSPINFYLFIETGPFSGPPFIDIIAWLKTNPFPHKHKDILHQFNIKLNLSTAWLSLTPNQSTMLLCIQSSLCLSVVCCAQQCNDTGDDIHRQHLPAVEPEQVQLAISCLDISWNVELQLRQVIAFLP